MQNLTNGKARIQWCGGWVLLYSIDENKDLLQIPLTKGGTVPKVWARMNGMRNVNTVREAAQQWCTANGYEYTL